MGQAGGLKIDRVIQIQPTGVNHYQEIEKRTYVNSINVFSYLKQNQIFRVFR